VPLYEYRCQRCGERFEVLQRLGAGTAGLACPRCGWTLLEREASAFASTGCTPRRGFT